MDVPKNSFIWLRVCSLYYQSLEGSSPKDTIGIFNLKDKSLNKNYISIIELMNSKDSLKLK